MEFFRRDVKSQKAAFHPIKISQVKIKQKHNLKFIDVVIDKHLKFTEQVQFLI